MIINIAVKSESCLIVVVGRYVVPQNEHLKTCRMARVKCISSAERIVTKTHSMPVEKFFISVSLQHGHLTTTITPNGGGGLGAYKQRRHYAQESVFHFSTQLLESNHTRVQYAVNWCICDLVHSHHMHSYVYKPANVYSDVYD